LSEHPAINEGSLPVSPLPSYPSLGVEPDPDVEPFGPIAAAPRQEAVAGMVPLPAKTFLMGTDDPEGYPEDGEGPVRRIYLSPFWIDVCAVSNVQFAAFVAATGYQTDAERYAWSFVFAGLLPDGFPPTRAVAHAPWWRQVYVASWRHPEGPHSDVDERPNYPVVHVSWRDARAYCRWVGTRLPTEAE
jgi:formylglycine-generating enzyme required for sulfatase activity